MTNTPIEESNLAHIASTNDKALKKAAAEMEMNWDMAGKSEGIQLWRVENKRDEETGNPKFGIKPWSKKHYGDFYSGDSYILLQTEKDQESGLLVYDIYFWIGSKSSQDEYGVAAYKANELDDLLNDAPVQHREVQFHESSQFLQCFNNKIKYLDGGIDTGFREVDENTARIDTPTRLYHVRRENRVTRCVEIPAKCNSLNHGDAFILHTSTTVYTWFGDEASPFEKSKAAEIAHNIVVSSIGPTKLVESVEDENDTFWSAIGGKGNIRRAIENEEVNTFEQNKDTKMYILSDKDSKLIVEEHDACKNNLASDDVCMIYDGNSIYVWIGSGSSNREQSQAMIMAQKHVASLGLQNISIVRVKEGQEGRISGFDSVLLQ